MWFETVTLEPTKCYHAQAVTAPLILSLRGDPLFSEHDLPERFYFVVGVVPNRDYLQVEMVIQVGRERTSEEAFARLLLYCLLDLVTTPAVGEAHLEACH